VVPESELLDPEKPLEPDELVNYFIGSREQQSAYRHIQKILLLAAGVLILAVLWRLTPAREWVDVQSAKAAGEWIRQQPFTPLMVMTAYVLGGLVAFPITLMVIASVIRFWGLVGDGLCLDWSGTKCPGGLRDRAFIGA
jgi:phospholipase D1/2